MFYLIGLGLGSEKDITVAGLEIVKRCKYVYLESYTSILSISHNQLELFYGRKVILQEREHIESFSDKILNEALKNEVALLVVGDPLGATTHTDLLLRARELNLNYKIIHNASICNAVASCGLQLYSFGQTISIPFFKDNWKPLSFYDRIRENQIGGNSHTLALLDIKVKEISDENLAKGKKMYEPPKFMTINQASEQLIESEDIKKECVLSETSLVVGPARLGTETELIKCGTLKQLSMYDFGEPLHSLVIVGKRLHDLEIDYLKGFAIDEKDFNNAVKYLKS